MSQIGLPLKLAENYSLDAYYPGPNHELLDVLVAGTVKGMAAPLYIWGNHGLGKSHLLQGVARKTMEQGSLAAYIPMTDPGIHPELLRQLQPRATLCLDDIHHISGNRAFEEALLDLYERSLSQGGQMIFSSQFSPAASNLALRDLVSRLSAGLVYRLVELDDQSKADAIKWRAHRRGLSISDQSAAYLLRRVSRDPGRLFELLERIDQASLEQ